jgi:hypothetical protein
MNIPEIISRPLVALDRFGRKPGQTEPFATGLNPLGERPPMGQSSHFSFTVVDSSNFVVARVNNALVTQSSELSEAYTKLFAAAPALLKALRELQANPNDPRAHRIALDAINLATA